MSTTRADILAWMRAHPGAVINGQRSTGYAARATSAEGWHIYSPRFGCPVYDAMRRRGEIRVCRERGGSVLVEVQENPEP